MNPFEALAKPLVHRPGDAEPPKPKRLRGTGSQRRAMWAPPVANPWNLTGAQCAVLRGLGSGMSSKAIAHRNGVASKTVDVHITRAIERMKAVNRYHALTLFARWEATCK